MTPQERKDEAKQMMLANPKSSNDKRHFLVCPHCGSTDINYMTKQLRITKYVNNKAVKTVTTTLKKQASTLCCGCLYEKGDMI